jgi:hypothetical protein
VSFNRKQADLIEEALEARAEADPAFRTALSRERDRVEGGEDMGFFVKNVENVQGDERDVIVFSSTFGKNAQGTFRRSFGVLGQVGGQRRLNVAVILDWIAGWAVKEPIPTAKGWCTGYGAQDNWWPLRSFYPDDLINAVVAGCTARAGAVLAKTAETRLEAAITAATPRSASEDSLRMLATFTMFVAVSAAMLAATMVGRLIGCVMTPLPPSLQKDSVELLWLKLCGKVSAATGPAYDDPEGTEDCSLAADGNEASSTSKRIRSRAASDGRSGAPHIAMRR